MTLSLPQLLGKELTYDQDLNGDGDIGDTIASVVDDMDGTEMYGLYKMASGAFAVGDSGLYESDVLNPAVALVADAKGSAWTTKATPLALNAQTNAKSGADELAVISMTGSGAKAVYVEELFTVSTDQTKATLTGKAVTLTALALAEKEVPYGQDLNLDGRIGSPVLMGSPSSGPFVLEGGISYHSVGVGSSTNRPVLEITGADANFVIGTDPSDNTAIMKAQQIYFSGLSIGVPRTGMTMGTASINDSAKLTIYGGLPIPGFKYDIPLNKTFAVLSAGSGKGTNGSLSVESGATVDMESNGTYFAVGCGLGVGATSISGAGTELNMLADEFGTIQVGCGDQTMGWLGGKGSLAVEDSAKVSLSSKSDFGVSIGIQKGEGVWTVSDAEITADVAANFWMGIGQDGAGELRLGSGASFLMSSDRRLGIDLGGLRGKGNLSVEDSLWEVNANNLNVNVGMSGGVGTIRLDNATVVLDSAPIPSANYDWTGTYVRVGGVGWDGKDLSSIGDALITNGTQFSVVGRHSGISIADGKGSKGKMVVDNGATVLVSSTDANKEYTIEDQDLFAFLNVGGTGWESYGGQGWLEISGAGTQFLISSDSPETGAHAS